MKIPMLYLIIAFAPLLGSILVGFFGTGFLGKSLERSGAHYVTILGVLVSFIGSVIALTHTLDGFTLNETLYTWSTVAQYDADKSIMVSDGFTLQIGFLIDNLTAMMMVVVTFVSLMVHIYTIGYMQGEEGYARFFSYISLFTFSMLMLVMSNNMLQLFFGWEAVGLVSYLLIGFYYKKPSAIFANMKAFLVNRVGDFGFVIGIGILFMASGTLDYAPLFQQAPNLATQQYAIGGSEFPLLVVAGIALFVGAMGKSAQFPLHVWLPDSMEGPTPISALIHAATMVTAGIFMVARFSPIYELAPGALSFIIVIGAITALFMGFLGIIQTDIKRVVAYSTLSQLGYMTVALGAGAYSVAVFHLMTHAFFKALLFLGAGSVIVGMHHEQDMRKMGGLWKYMPITWITSILGSLALIGTPFLSGFYSKENIIEAAKLTNIPGAESAYWAVLLGVFVTAFYSFRMVFMVFHGKERFLDAHGDDHGHHHGEHAPHTPHESPWVITVPLILLAIPSVLIGAIAVEPFLFGSFFNGVIDGMNNGVMQELKHHFHGWLEYGLHAFLTLPFWLAFAGVACAAIAYLVKPCIPGMIYGWTRPLAKVLENKYYLDSFNQIVFAGGAKLLGLGLWKIFDRLVIDIIIVGGAAALVRGCARVVRPMQTGYIYHYAFAMILGMMLFVMFFVLMLV